MEKEGPLFALDVGTRKIAGLVLSPRDKGYYIQAAEVVEHEQRTMLDGQIHDIPQVAEAIIEVKEKLEKNKKTFKRGCSSCCWSGSKNQTGYC
ncbi:MAG: hypothetical protein PWP31_1215 [Clostridia bacterium]|nr:hypothetical protein [Clostridia bacterium]